MTPEQYDRISEEEFLQFGRIPEERRLSNRADLHAFLLLDQLVPGTGDMVSAAEHDEFFLDVSPDELAKVATEEQITDLIRCGVRYHMEFDCLAMFA